MMNKSILKKVLIITIITLGITGVNAQERDREERDHRTPPTFEQLLEKMDTDKDGQLSEQEIKGPLKRDFSRVDTNEDGFITKEELENAPKPERRNRN